MQVVAATGGMFGTNWDLGLEQMVGGRNQKMSPASMSSTVTHSTYCGSYSYVQPILEMYATVSAININQITDV